MAQRLSNATPSISQRIVDEIKPLVEAGFAVHWLHEREKRPIGNDWSEKPVYSYDELQKSYRNGYNVGVRLGEPSEIDGLYLHVMDVDIRNFSLESEAYDALEELIPDVWNLPTVISGSGGASRHFYFLLEQPFRSKKLRHSEGSFVDAAGKKHWDWEIELFGTGKQVAMPPSIHPDTGKPYVWDLPFDPDDLDAITLPLDQVQAWSLNSKPAATTSDDDDLATYVALQPLDLTQKQIDETLALLPLPDWCDDRDGWLQVGMALHHQFEGGIEGLNLWNTFSRQSDKFDAKDQGRVWKSFTARAGGVRFSTLLQAAAAEKDRLMVEDLEESAASPPTAVVFDDEIEALLGSTTTAGESENTDPSPNLHWTSLLDKNEEGGTKSTLHNLTMIIRHDPRTRGLPERNLFTGETVQRSAPGRKKADRSKNRGEYRGTKQLSGAAFVVDDKVNGKIWSNSADTAIRDVLEAPTKQGGYGIKVSDRDLKGAIDLVGLENAFHPVREYLEKGSWDGSPRAEALFVDYFGAADTPYTRSVAKMFLVAAVTRIYEPGHKFDFAVILEGLQGKRKSTFIEVLAKEWFSELDGDYHDTKEMVESMQGSWILEIPELSNFSRSDVRQIKAFISRRFDKVRLAYKPRAEQFPRQCVFIGSTNDSRYLQDPTGGRRWWPIHCELQEVDTDRLTKNVDQIWHETLTLYRSMRAEQPQGRLPLFLSDERASSEAVEMQESRRVESAEDAMAGQIGAWLDSPWRGEGGLSDTDLNGDEKRNRTCLAQIWSECFGRDAAAYGQQQAQQIGRAMNLVDGWHALPGGVRKIESYGKQRIYERIGWNGI